MASPRTDEHDHERQPPAIITRTRPPRRDRSGLRHDGRSAHRQASRTSISGQHLLLLLGRLPRQVRRRSAEISRQHARAAEPVPEGTIYTCPMHPRDPAGRARLLPDLRHGARSRRSPPPTAGPNPELVDMTRRFWIGAGADAAGVRAGDGRAPDRPAHRLLGQTLSNWIQLAFATPVVLWAGWPFFVRGWQSLRHAQSQHVHADRDGHRRRLGLQRRRDASRPALFPPAFRGHDGAVAVYFEAAAVITVLVLLGQVLELRARERDLAARSARCSISRRRRRAASSDDGSDEEVPLDAVAVGDRLRVRPGEKVPVDGDRARRPLRARRIDGDRRIDAGHQGRRRAR